VPLTEQQQAALPALDWLIGGERRTGRSLVMAVAIIRAACRNPEVPFYLVDHFNSTRDSRNYVGTCIDRLLHHSPLPEYARFSLNRERLVVYTPQSFEWEPNLEDWGPFSASDRILSESEYQRQIRSSRRPRPPASPSPPLKPAFQRILEDFL
jgi:hypothetical protein